MFPFKRKPILDKDDQHLVVAAIKEAEGKTTGEIRVFIEHKCSYMDALHRAKEVFGKLKMHKSLHKNAVLIYLAVQDRQYAIFGDSEIYEKAGGQQFWEHAANLLKTGLQQHQATDGLVNCIHEVGKVMAAHYPYDEAVKKNDLPDEIVFGK